MGFLSGRVTCCRFRVLGQRPALFDEEHLAQLAAFAIGTQRFAAADGVEVGWVAGDHVLDTRFDLAKNIVNDALQFAIRVDTLKLPGDLLRAYYQVELDALAAGNPSGLPSARQKREARAAAKDRLEAEAGDGRYLKRKLYPVLWDAQTGEVLVGATSGVLLDRVRVLFEKTFDRKLELITAGTQAFWLAERHQQTRGVDDALPSPFVPGTTPAEVAWVPDEASRDYFGNEFLLWLWFVLDSESDSIALADASEVAVMLARSLTLECPRGQTGKEVISSDGPTHLPEAKRAIQAGKLPRKVGLTVVRHDRQYELTLTAETLAIGSARLPAPEEEEDRARLEERVTLIRHLIETLDLLFDAFNHRRSGVNWPKELARVQKWLQREERGRLGGTGS